MTYHSSREAIELVIAEVQASGVQGWAAVFELGLPSRGVSSADAPIAPGNGPVI